MYCQKCGTKNAENDNFCSYCGNILKHNEQEINNASTNVLPQNNNNLQYVLLQKQPLNYGLFALIASIAILPISLIIRFCCAETVTRYGWRAYTTTILPDGMKVLGVILSISLLAVSIAFMCVESKNKPSVKNKYKVPTIIIDIIATAFSFAFIFG